MRRTDRNGFTMVEVIVTLLLLTVVAVSLVGANQHVARVLQRSRLELNAARFLEAEVERLRLTPYASVQDGQRTDGRGIVTWTVLDSTSFRQVVVRTRYGSAASGFVSDSLTIYRTDGS
jgi:prepilin-type N-terminal cleavage/methylation domain-containing protein